MWPIILVEKDSGELPAFLQSLYRNEIAALVIKNFWSKEKCEKAVRAVTAHGFEYYKDVYPPIGRIGITQFEHRFTDELKSQYFRKAPKSNAVRADMFRDIGDPVTEVMRLFGHFADARIAAEPSGEEYFSGLVRHIREALLHFDFVPKDSASGWGVSGILAQASWNIILQDAESGGQTIVYRRLCGADDKVKQAGENYGYDMESVRGCEEAIIAGEAGDFIIFNSQNFHRVLPTEGGRLRLTVSSFVGLTEEGALLLWS